MAEDLDREAWQQFALMLGAALRRDGAITASELERIRIDQLGLAAERPGAPAAMRARRIAQLADFLLSGTPLPDPPGLRIVREQDEPE